MDSENVTKWTDYLEPISSFIATHGLAVFLVVYYATILYPDAVNERGQWIKELTELRSVVDPDSRPLKPNQAKIITDYVIDSFLVNLENELQTSVHRQSGFREFSITGWSGGGSTESISAGDTEFELDMEEPLEPQLIVLNERFKEFQLSGEREIIFSLEGTYEKVVRRAQFSTGRLAEFNFDNGTLYDVWVSAFGQSKNWFKEAITKAFVFDIHRENNRSYLRLIQTHKEYRQGMVLLPVDGQSLATTLSEFRARMESAILAVLRPARVMAPNKALNLTGEKNAPPG